MMARRARLHARERTMRELVAQYLSKGISRRGFVGGLTEAGLTATAAQSVLSAVTTVTTRRAPVRSPLRPRQRPRLRQRPRQPRRRRCRRRREAVPRPGQRPLRRAAHRLWREIRVRQLGQRGCAILRGAGRPAAAQYILTPHEGPGAAMAAGYIRRRASLRS
jgi:hypothetical protein